MWLVAKIKKNEFQLFKKTLDEKIKNVQVYAPKYECSTKTKSKKIIKFILNSYVFINSPNFSDDYLIRKLKYTKGLEYLLEGFKSNQNQIVEFINYCKKNEDPQGNLNQTFFLNLSENTYKFVSGPFKNFVLNLLNVKKNNVQTECNGKLISFKNEMKFLLVPKSL
jgi:hypothetical protein